MSVPVIQALRILEIHDNANLENTLLQADMTRLKMDVIRILDNARLVLSNESIYPSLVVDMAFGKHIWDGIT